jgi:SAM-dependent methyltransferase
MMDDDGRRFAPSAARNRDPIVTAIRQHMPATGLLLEIASGTGEHAVHFARHFPDLIVQPSDPDENARASIDAWVDDVKLPNLQRAARLDVISDEWPIQSAEAIVCINMIHISPWQATVCLMTGAARALANDGVLILYGPYKRDGAHTAPSNEAFDQDLRTRNPLWGIRDLETVVACAADHGFGAPVIVPMPANNLTLLFKRPQPSIAR